MLVVAYDPNNKNVVRGVYQVPHGVSYETACQIVRSAYQHADDPEETLAEQGYDSEAFIPAEVKT